MRDVGVLSYFFCICLPSSSHQTWSLTNLWPCGYFPCASLTKVVLTEQVHPAPKSRLLRMESQVSYWFIYFFSGPVRAYCCIWFIHLLSLAQAHHSLAGNVCATSLMVQALYVALLRIVQLAFYPQAPSSKFTSSHLNYQVHCRWLIICVMLILANSVSADILISQLHLQICKVIQRFFFSWCIFQTTLIQR